MRVLLVTTAWMILSLLAWSGVRWLLMFSMMYLVNERQWRIPDWSVDLLNYGGIAGLLVFPTVVAVLGMRGKLPGIRLRSKGRGFPID